MATQVRTQSSNGQVITYTITDEAGNQFILTVNKIPGQNLTIAGSGGAVLPDGAQTLAVLLQLVSTGLLP